MNIWWLISSVRSSLPTMCMNTGQVAITIDEGPTEYTEKLLKILKKENVPVTFHFNPMIRGQAVGEIYQRVQDDGHEIGFRTSPTRDYADMDDDSIKKDLNNQLQYFQTKAGEKVKFARSPLNGAVPIDAVHKFFIDKGIVQTSYSFCPYDDEENDPVDNLDEFFAPTFSQHDSFIIQLYEQRLGEDDNLKDLIKVIRSHGYEFVTLSDCLEGFKPGDVQAAAMGGGTIGRNFSPEMVCNAFVHFMLYYYSFE